MSIFQNSQRIHVSIQLKSQTLDACHTDYNHTGDRDSYSCPSNALSPCPALREPEKAEKEYEEV